MLSCQDASISSPLGYNAKVISLSEPVCMQWDNMVPSPWGEASYAKMSSSSGSKCTRRSNDCIHPLECCLSGLAPRPVSILLQQIVKGCCSGGSVGQKLPIVVHKPQEGSQFCSLALEHLIRPAPWTQLAACPPGRSCAPSTPLLA